MDHQAKLFDNFIVLKKEEKTIFKGQLAYYGLERFGYLLLYLVPPALMYYCPFPSFGVASVDFVFHILIKFVLMVAAFLLGKKYIRIFLSRTLLVVDKSKQTLVLDLDGESIGTPSVKDIVFVQEDWEEAGIKTSYFRIKVLTEDTEKQTGFAFASSKKAEKFIVLLKESIPLN